MGANCCGASPEPSVSEENRSQDPRWLRILWIALALNLAMFAVEIVAGLFAQSRSLQADALDFLGDAANYAISLGVAGLALHWRARTALLKGLTILVFALGVFASALWGLIHGAAPDGYAMGYVGLLALVVNLAVAAMLFRYRSGDANMRSVWICSRNDAINNLLVIAAGLVVVATGSALPDLLVAFVMAVLGISGGWHVVRQAQREIAESAAPAPAE